MVVSGEKSVSAEMESDATPKRVRAWVRLRIRIESDAAPKRGPSETTCGDCSFRPVTHAVNEDGGIGAVGSRGESRGDERGDPAGGRGRLLAPPVGLVRFRFGLSLAASFWVLRPCRSLRSCASSFRSGSSSVTGSWKRVRLRGFGACSGPWRPEEAGEVSGVSPALGRLARVAFRLR